jgi:RNA polymerase sigma factor (sigma-70 family)
MAPKRLSRPQVYVELNMGSRRAKDRGERGNDPASEIDDRIVHRCIAGDEDALRSFVEFYQERLFTFLAGFLGPGAHVEDVAQVVFIKAHASFPCYDPSQMRPFAWLMYLARAKYKAIDLFREQRRFEPLDADPSASMSLRSSDDPELNTYHLERSRRVQRAVALLSPVLREALLFWMLGVPDTEIAAALNCKVSTVKSRIIRAREKLEKPLSIYQSEVGDV